MVKHNINRHGNLGHKLALGLLAAAATAATAATTSLPVLRAQAPACTEAIVSRSACVLEDDDHAAPIASAALVARNANYLLEMSDAQHWNKNVVRVRVEGTDGKRKPEESRRLLEQSAALWNDQVGSIIHFEWTDDSDADVIIRFAPASTLPSRAVGKTDAQFKSISRTLVHADITLAEGMKADRLLQVAAHEMGHALGVCGHSPSSADLMFPITHTPARITERDRNTMCLNYQASLPR